MGWKDVTGGAVMAAVLTVTAWGAAPGEVADAAMNGDAAAVRRLLAEGADVNGPQADGATALHWAVYMGDVELVDLLIRSGADVQAANRVGATPLAMAALYGNAAAIERLLASGADANERGPVGETPLMMAARNGDVASIDALVAAGADVNAKEPLRETSALMWAAEQGNTAAVRRLIERGADIAAQSKITEVEGRRGGRVSVVQFTPTPEAAAAAAEGAPPLPAGQVAAADADQDQGQTPGFVASLGGGDDTIVRTGGITALTLAARQGDQESVRILLEAGADVNQPTAEGWTALLMATNNRYYQLADFLIENGADVNHANDNGWTPLYLATDNRNVEGGDYPTRKPDMDHLEYIRLLLDRGADPNARAIVSTETRTVFTNQWLNENGATPFLRAAQSGDVTLMRLLLEHGADPSIRTAANITALQVAAGIGWVEGLTYEWSPEESLEAVKLTLDLGLDVNNVDDNGRTALHGAAHKGRNEVVQLLVDAGARMDVRDKGSRDTRDGPLVGYGWLPLDFAEGLVRVGVQSAIPHPETAALLRRLMTQAGLEVPRENRNATLSICLTDVCQ